MFERIIITLEKCTLCRDFIVKLTFRFDKVYSQNGFCSAFFLLTSQTLLQLCQLDLSLENTYSKICLKRPLKNRQNKELNDKW